MWRKDAKRSSEKFVQFDKVFCVHTVKGHSSQGPTASISGKQMLQEVTISLHDVVMVFSGHSDMGGSEAGVVFGGHWFFMMLSLYVHHKGTAS